MNRQTEFTLLIVGASLSILVFLGAVFYSLIFGFNTLMVADTFGYYSGSDEAIVFGIITFFSVVAAFFALVSAVFGFIGAFKIKSNGPKVKQLGVCFIILGGLQVFTIHGILFLIAGILTVTKKEYKTISKEDEGTKWE
ncbi:DUF4064 domain-containing protein [Listeria monocytogenes]|uniref:DUF4064 domain-containing protein n=1 Tax=Listeria monocytogenes TaxID=1639 RepID=A0A5Y9DK73_LISMN|nr:DUF4064 domain-containing protein [Listeria monocytogenes]EAC7954537.1 DUF4064 domain-containing protein [Listeria monocytogenes]EAC9890278.1 DUF4064 domain-containing protein [Listeria monocytogenes]EAD0071319.1 DUF4064 domain-containing protein [Listeria monocytogenes]EAD0695492.1 DUF4064 domain-containing protein [Listeria monocytogenes]EAD6805807.1 DUF4064 domain-containing protein [Listeria monocytogenes]